MRDMASWRNAKILKKSSLVSNPDLLEKLDLILIGHIFLTHKGIVHLLKISGSHFSLLHAQYIVFTNEILVVFRTGMKKIYIWDQIYWSFLTRLLIMDQ